MFLLGHRSLTSGEGYSSLCLVGKVAGVVWHLQGSGLPKSLYGVQYTCYCPVFCWLITNAGSGFEGFLFVQGAGEPLHPAQVLLRWFLTGVDESSGALTHA